MIYPNSYVSDSNFKPGDFVLSSVNSFDLKKYGIKKSVKEFKAEVKQSNNYKVIITGGAGYSCHTRVYNFNDFVKKVVPKQTSILNTDYWWNKL